MSHETPSDRDLDIYYAVYLSDTTQAEIAAQFELSQSQVSKIAARVRLWVGAQKSQEGLTEEQELFVAADLQLHKLRQYERKTRAAFDRTCAEPTTISGVIRPDVRLLKQAVDCAKAVYEAHCDQIKASTACKEAHAARCKLGIIEEPTEEYFEPVEPSEIVAEIPLPQVPTPVEDKPYSHLSLKERRRLLRQQKRNKSRGAHAK